jgi:nucleoside-triphosphatase
MDKIVSRPHILLLTGVPGIGKTTVIRDVARVLPAGSLRGFYTQEIREHGRRMGFRLTTFHGEEGVMAHVDFPHRAQVGKYRVDVATVDRLAEAALRPAHVTNVYLVDEIGKMECLSQRFVTALRTLLASENLVVATVARKGGGLIREVKARNDVQIWEVTRANRNDLSGEVLAWLQQGHAVGR